MARETGSVCKFCRREGQKLFLKGERCYSEKCAFNHRSYAPGQHGQSQSRKKSSEYGIQLRQKQKARRYYGVLEAQFSKYYDMAATQKGMTGENLLKILESRMDNAVYRAGFANSRKEARQLITHRHYTINGKTVNVPSYLLKAGDVIAIKDTDCEKIKQAVEANSARPKPQWMTVDAQNSNVKIDRLPERSEIDFEVEEHFIVEYYSK